MTPSGESDIALVLDATYRTLVLGVWIKRLEPRLDYIKSLTGLEPARAMADELRKAEEDVAIMLDVAGRRLREER